MEYETKLKFWKISARTYIKTFFDKIETLFYIKLKNYGSPMETGDYPEMDESDLLDQEQIAQYQMLIGRAIWDVTLGRYDVQYAKNPLVIFSQQPIEVHMNRSFRMFGYLNHHKQEKIHFHPQQINT